MSPLKAPGPNGFPVHFYQENWATLGGKVCEAFFKFFRFSRLDATVNKTHIALIPKLKNPSKVSEYHPISLYNVLYKILAKVLANRLKGILPDIISWNQSAFIPGRLISDNILMAYEALHTMHSQMWR